MKLRSSTLCSLSPCCWLLATACGGGGSDDPGTPPPPPIDLALELVTTDVVFPTFLASAPGDATRLFIVEKSGTIRIFRNGAVLPVPFLDLSAQTSSDIEQGLLSVAFPPDYAQSGRFYVAYTDLAGTVHVVRHLRSPADPDVALAAPDQVVLSIAKTSPSHNGGQLAFGPDGFLYVSIGDDWHAGDAAQSPNDLLGSLLRIDVDPQGSYAIPPDNPYVGVPGARGEVWSVGLRNPWRFSFDRETGDLWIGDVGENTYEEIDVSLAAQGGGAGANYGWRVMQGPNCFEPLHGCDASGLETPAFTYPHHGNSCAVIGGYVYRGSAIPSLQGTYFLADLCAASIQSFRLEAGQVAGLTSYPSMVTGGMITSLGEDAAGELYVLTNWGGVFRIVAQ